MEKLLEAVREYQRKRAYDVEVVATHDGFWRPPENDICPLCQNAKWSCSTGAHLKTQEHISLKWGIAPKLLIDALDLIHYRPSNIAWKNLLYTESSYLRSMADREFIWIPETTMESRCETCTDGPEIGCLCGLYFFWNPYKAWDYWIQGITVQCLIGGNIVEATEGCRAQFAKITGILSIHEKPDAREIEMAEMYQVPIVTEFTEDWIDDLKCLL